MSISQDELKKITDLLATTKQKVVADQIVLPNIMN